MCGQCLYETNEGVESDNWEGYIQVKDVLGSLMISFWLENVGKLILDNYSNGKWRNFFNVYCWLHCY